MYITRLVLQDEEITAGLGGLLMETIPNLTISFMASVKVSLAKGLAGS